MNLSISKLFIPTTNKARSLAFLSSIFDCEICTDLQGNDYTELAGLNIHFTEKEKIKPIKEATFYISVDCLQDLDDLKNKIEFYYYRENLKYKGSLIEGNQLSFKDPEKNLWIVEVSINTLLKPSVTFADDVRNY